MWFDRKVDDVVVIQQCVFYVKGLFDGQPAVVLGIDDHVFFLIGYSVQGNLLSFVVGEHVVERYDCHIFAGVFRWHGILITAVGDEAVFLHPAQIDFVDDILAFQRVQALFFNLSKGISFVVACTFPLTLLHQARA